MKEEQLKFMLLLPAIFFLISFGIFPIAYTIVISFTSLEFGKTANFIGVTNYIRALKDVEFITALKNTFFFTALAVSLELTLGLGLALILNRGFKGSRYFRGIFLLPMMLPATGLAVIFTMIFNYQLGPLNYLLKVIGIGPINWTGSEAIAPYTIILLDVWQWTPFMMIILLAGLQSLPKEPFEAAMLDGADRWSIFRYITFPMIYPITLVAVLLRAIDVFKIFDIIYVLTGGGPGGTATMSMSLWVYLEGPVHYKYAYASAGGVILLFLSAFIFSLFLRILRGGVR